MIDLRLIMSLSFKPVYGSPTALYLKTALFQVLRSGPGLPKHCIQQFHKHAKINAYTRLSAQHIASAAG